MKYVEIDGERYMIDACVNCMFMDVGDSGYGAHCNYHMKKGYIDLEDVYYTAYDEGGVRVSERCGLREVGE